MNKNKKEKIQEGIFFSGDLNPGLEKKEGDSDMAVLEKDELELLETWVTERNNRLPSFGERTELGPHEAGEAKMVATDLVHRENALPVDELIQVLKFAVGHHFHGAKVLKSLLYFNRFLAQIVSDYRNDKARKERSGQAQFPGYTPSDDPRWGQPLEGWTVYDNGKRLESVG